MSWSTLTIVRRVLSASVHESIEDLWQSHLGCLSIQVMQEFCVVATQKIVHPLDRATTERICVILRAVIFMLPLPRTS